MKKNHAPHLLLPEEVNGSFVAGLLANGFYPSGLPIFNRQWLMKYPHRKA